MRGDTHEGTVLPARHGEQHGVLDGVKEDRRAPPARRGGAGNVRPSIPEAEVAEAQANDGGPTRALGGEPDRLAVPGERRGQRPHVSERGSEIDELGRAAYALDARHGDVAAPAEAYDGAAVGMQGDRVQAPRLARGRTRAASARPPRQREPVRASSTRPTSTSAAAARMAIVLGPAGTANAVRSGVKATQGHAR